MRVKSSPCHPEACRRISFRARNGKGDPSASLRMTFLQIFFLFMLLHITASDYCYAHTMQTIISDECECASHQPNTPQDTIAPSELTRSNSHFKHNETPNKPKIVTSITPLAAIVKMLVRDSAIVIPIASNDECPHHYHLKPSDLDLIKHAATIIYIDDHFDGFTTKLMKQYNSNLIKISDFPNIRVIKNNNYTNWHIWLDLDNVRVILSSLKTILPRQVPELAGLISNNYEFAIKHITNLSKIKKEKLVNVTDLVLLSDSAEYFFHDNDQFLITRLYSTSQKSLKYIHDLEQMLSYSSNKCLIISNSQDQGMFKKFKSTTIVELASENWPLIQITDDSFYDQYLKMIHNVAKCKQDSAK